jgi:hypothetical protein
MCHFLNMKSLPYFEILKSVNTNLKTTSYKKI